MMLMLSHFTISTIQQSPIDVFNQASFNTELNRRTAASPAERNNILISLSDLVVHYTALVDAHFTPQLAARIVQDPNEVVRRQSLALLANLLQKDYVKWRGVVVFQ